MKLRLLLFPDCNRRCRGCCNKGFDLEALPICTDYTKYNQIMITGGESMLHQGLIEAAYNYIRTKTGTSIVLYTAKPDPIEDFMRIFHLLDGITLTLHTRKDIEPFIVANNAINNYYDQIAPMFTRTHYSSLRLNVFDGISLKGINTDRWKVKKNIKWIKDCPLPQDEVFMRF